MDLGGCGRDNGAGGSGGSGEEPEVEFRRSGCKTGAGSAGGDGACCSTTSASAAGASSTATAQRRDTAETRGTGARDSSGRGEDPDAAAIAGHVPPWNATPTTAPSSASLDGVAQQEEAQRQRGRRQGASVRHCYVLPEEAQEHHHEGQEEAPSPPPFRRPLLVTVVRCVGEPGLHCSHHQRPSAGAASTTAPSPATAVLHLLQSLQEGQQEPPHPLRRATAAATPASTHSPVQETATASVSSRASGTTAATSQDTAATRPRARAHAHAHAAGAIVPEARLLHLLPAPAAVPAATSASSAAATTGVRGRG